MSVPVASVISPTENGAARSGPPCGCPNAAPDPALVDGVAGQRGPVEVGGGEHGQVAVRDRRRRRWPRTSEPSLRCRIVSSSPATTCALVTTRPSPTTNPLPSWMRSHATPSTLTVDGTTASTTGCGMLVEVGGGPDVGRRARAHRTRAGTGPRRRAGGACRRCRAAPGSDRRRSGRSPTSAPARANQPGTSAMSGMRIQTPMRTPTTPATAPADRSAERTVEPGKRGVELRAHEQTRAPAPRTRCRAGCRR